MLYIPIDIEIISQIEESENLSQLIGALSIAELAGLNLIQLLLDIEKKIDSDDELPELSEQYLFNFIKEIDSDSIYDARVHALDNFNLEKLHQGMAVLNYQDISLMNADQVREKKYLDRNGYWDWGFKDRVEKDFENSAVLERVSIHNRSVTLEQERMLSIIISESDESLDVQGYAGTGKTKLISYMVDAIDESRLCLLATSRAQLDSMLSRLNKKPYSNTFVRIAISSLENNRIGLVKKISQRYFKNLSDSPENIVKKLSCYPLGDKSAKDVAIAAKRAVSSFCYSGDNEITLDHIGYPFLNSELEHKMVVLGLAQNIWDIVCIPRDDINLPIWGYHLIKAMALSNETIPNYYTHVIVDETHDLPKPVIQILDRSPQAVFTFGDKYQALNGIRSLTNRGLHIRNKQMSHSVRVGDNVSGLYNKIISQYPVPETQNIEFNGSKTKKTKITQYDKFSIPDYYCAILTNNNWSTFEIMQRLAKTTSRFRIMLRAKSDLKKLINGAILFYTGDKSSHPEFSKYDSWDSYVEKNYRPVIARVDELLKKGYGFSDLDKALSKESSDDANDVYIIGRVEDSRNMEFDRVVLFDDKPNVVKKSDEAKSQLVSHVYTGISRAKHELIIPSNLDSWFDDFL